MKLERRTVKGSKVRKDGLTPGILYGKGIESVSVQVSQSEFQKVYNKKGTSKTFEATLEGKKHIVYIKQTQAFAENFHVKSHFDLVKVSAGDTMTSKIHLVFVNHEEVEKRGLIVQSVMDTIEVEYEVGAGISKLELDVAGMTDHDTLSVKDIVAPKGVTILEDPEQVVVSISTPKEEVEVDPDAEVEVVTEVESIKQSNE
jgi:large subunit ribosomal protein L25